MSIHHPTHNRPTSTGNERGMALALSILFLLLTSVLTLTFMITVKGERSLSSNVHVAKGALYAADAGVRVAQQTVARLAQAKLDSLISIWSGTGPVITEPGRLFPTDALVTTASNPSFSANTVVAFTDSQLTERSQVYNFLATTTSTGQQGALGRRRVESQSVLRVSASRGSFADFLLFTDIHLTPGGGNIWFTSDSQYDGRVHTNTQYRFAYFPGFQDLASSVNNEAWFYNRGRPKALASDHNRTIDVPNFYGGFNRGVPSIEVPDNAFSQQNAALGLSPESSAQPSNTTINAQLGTSAGSSSPPAGVYLVNSAASVAGGIYVQGDLDQYLMKLDGFGRQVYVLEQGSTVTTFTLDRAVGQTLMDVNGTTTTFAGLPRGIAFVNGQIDDLRGPDRSGSEVLPAIESANQLLVTATEDIIVRRDVAVEDFETSYGVLGLYSSGGSVRIGMGAPDDMALDAYVMAIGGSGAFTVDNYSTGSPRGTFHLRGGAVTTYYGAFFTFNSRGQLRTGYARDFRYDRRGLVPPYYPTTNRFTSDRPTARTTVWREL